MTETKMKRGPLSNQDKKYIEKNKDREVEWIFKKINKSPDLISKYIEQLNTPVQEATVEEVQVVEPVLVEKTTTITPEVKEPSNTIKAGELMSRRESHGAVVMTEAASMVSDATRPTLPPKTMRNIHIIKKT